MEIIVNLHIFHSFMASIIHHPIRKPLIYKDLSFIGYAIVTFVLHFKCSVLGPNDFLKIYLIVRLLVLSNSECFRKNYFDCSALEANDFGENLLNVW